MSEINKAVIFGAGQNGAGFVGRNLSSNGYELVFLDVSQDALDYVAGMYEVNVASLDELRSLTIHGTRGILLEEANLEAIAQEIAGSDLVVTAVGKKHLGKTIPYLGAGLERFLGKSNGTKNIIFAENHPTAAAEIREGLGNLFPEAGSRVGLVNSVVHVMGRRDADGSFVSEDYTSSDFPVDKDAFKGEMPRLTMLPYSPFEQMEHRKLYLHNLMHFAVGLLASKKGYTTVADTAQDAEVREFAVEVTSATIEALSMAYRGSGESFSKQALTDHRNSIYQRAANPHLGDTVARLIADPARYLSKGDRVVGAGIFCLNYGVDATPIARVAAMGFALPQFAEEIQRDGIAAVIYNCTGLRSTGFESMIKREYQSLS